MPRRSVCWLDCMLITYGLSKGFMSVLADKSNPRYFMATGLILCILINIAMGFSTSFYLFVGLVVLLGLCQGMGVGPSIITVGHWFSRSERGRASTSWNVSHNIGGGLVAPIVGAAMAYLWNRTLAYCCLHCSLCCRLDLCCSRITPGEASPCRGRSSDGR